MHWWKPPYWHIWRWRIEEQNGNLQSTKMGRWRGTLCKSVSCPPWFLAVQKMLSRVQSMAKKGIGHLMIWLNKNRGSLDMFFLPVCRIYFALYCIPWGIWAHLNGGSRKKNIGDVLWQQSLLCNRPKPNTKPRDFCNQKEWDDEPNSGTRYWREREMMAARCHRTQVRCGYIYI